MLNHQTSVSVLTFPLWIGFPRKFSLRLILITTLFLIISLLIFYVFQVGMVVKGNYLIRNYSQELKNLSMENERLGVEATQNLSLGSIEKEIQELNFVPVSKVSYIPISYDYLVKETH